MIEILVVLGIAIGAFFMLVASIGVLRLGDFYSRLHAPTKAATLGLVFLLLGVILWLGEPVVATKAILGLLFIGATAPVGAHILARAAYRTGVAAAENTGPDEYAAFAEAQRPRTLARQASDLEHDPSDSPAP